MILPLQQQPSIPLSTLQSATRIQQSLLRHNPDARLPPLLLQQRLHRDQIQILQGTQFSSRPLLKNPQLSSIVGFLAWLGETDRANQPAMAMRALKGQ
jgi:hypothetical protein